MTDQELLKFITNSCFKLEFNMNDTFHYACSDIANISGDDFEDLIPYIRKYNYDAIIAYEAVKRGYDPDIKQNITKEFKQCKKEILEQLNDQSNKYVFFDLRQEFNEKKEDLEIFGEEVLYSSCQKKSGEVKSIAYLDKKNLFTIDINSYQARKKLITMFKENNKYLKSMLDIKREQK